MTGYNVAIQLSSPRSDSFTPAVPVTVTVTVNVQHGYCAGKLSAPAAFCDNVALISAFSPQQQQQLVHWLFVQPD